VIGSETGDAIAIRPIGVLAQSFDHRAVDGAYSAAYLRTLKGLIEARDWEAAMNL
jgi:2-oxoglutarate dehydrogenase E2 component (dihydrolipoamide succinyltransferase)